MNTHLQMVREFRDAFALPQAVYGEQTHISDMDIVMRQAWLMEAGSKTLRALKKGDMADILVNLMALAYCALSAIARQGGSVIERPVMWRHDGSVMSVMRLISDKINRCESGEAVDYSAVYCACIQLTRSFLNADFDRSFRMFHASRMEDGKNYGADEDKDVNSDQYATPDLSDCLFE
ncbi:MAG: nucleoside triphosphate pyrophosphohydrolase family protein [Gammaproteobacteria bacterium]